MRSCYSCSLGFSVLQCLGFSLFRFGDLISWSLVSVSQFLGLLASRRLAFPAQLLGLSGFLVSFFRILGLSDSRLLGFSAFWLLANLDLTFSVSRLLGFSVFCFSDSRLLSFSVSRLFAFSSSGVLGLSVSAPRTLVFLLSPFLGSQAVGWAVSLWPARLGRVRGQ